MKQISTAALLLGVSFSLSAFAMDSATTTTTNTTGTMTTAPVASTADTKAAMTASPRDLVGVQLTMSDGTQAMAFMQRQDAAKFNQATGITATVVSGNGTATSSASSTDETVPATDTANATTDSTETATEATN